uniref:Uncharacterized protein n=1 Tax=Anguilla anguilla TaxID=7936 RepID=A0A0E9QQW8_ANGAN
MRNVGPQLASRWSSELGRPTLPPPRAGRIQQLKSQRSSQ